MLIEHDSKWIFFGDSITDAGREKPAGEGGLGALGNGYVNMTAGFLDAVYPDYNIRVINKGINGNNIRDLHDRFEEDVASYKPDYLSVLIGVNDVWRFFDTPHLSEKQVDLPEYTEKYELLIKKIEKEVPELKKLFLMVPYYNEPNRTDRMRAKLDGYGEQVKRLGEKYGACVVDLQTAFDNFCKYCHSNAIGWDRVHPNNVGCAIITREVLSAVQFDWNRKY